MTKKDFLNQLKTELINRGIKDSDEIVSFHEEIIDGKIEMGLSEDKILDDYQSISSIVNELLSEEKSSGGFSYADYINESHGLNIKNAPLVTPTKKGRDLTYQIDVNESSAINLAINSRKVYLSADANSNNLTVNYRNTFTSALLAHKSGDNILIREKHRNILLSIMIYLLIFAALFLVTMQIFELTLWWHYVTALVAISSITQLWWVVLIFYYKDYDKVYITVPNRFILNELGLIIRSGKLYVNNLVANDLSVKIVSGVAHLDDTYANNFDLKISSGSLKLGQETKKLNRMVNSLNLHIRSGKAKINGISATNIYAKVSSGKILLDDVYYKTSKFIVSSGTIKGGNVIIDNGNFKVTSGSIKLNSISLNQLALDVRSGIIRLDDIIGTKNDFLISAKVRSGVVRINHDSFNTFGYKLVTALPQKSISGSVSSGRLILNFKNDTGSN